MTQLIVVFPSLAKALNNGSNIRNKTGDNGHAVRVAMKARYCSSVSIILDFIFTSSQKNRGCMRVNARVDKRSLSSGL
jgi:hypothetical protein